MSLPMPAWPAVPASLRPAMSVDQALKQAALYPHLRYMGSKYRLLPALAGVFDQLEATTALDPFAGSGIVSYLLKAQGYAVTSRDYLSFPVALARAALSISRRL